MTPIEAIGTLWAEWASEQDGPRYDPALGYSLGDSAVSDKAGMAGKSDKDSGLRTAKGVHTRSMRSDGVEEPLPTVAAWESGMVSMKQHQPVLWSVGLAYYLGEVPIGFRSAHKMRRRRFRVDDGTGMVVARHERLTPLAGEGKLGWKRRLGRRLLMTPRTFDEKLAMFHERMGGWIDSRVSRLEIASA